MNPFRAPGGKGGGRRGDAMKQIKALVPIAPGFEEVEALTVVDILRRAGAEAVMAGTPETNTEPIEGRNGIRVLADATMDDVTGTDFDVIILPGGAGGTEALRKDARVKEAVKKQFERGGLVAAICAAPTVLSDAGITEGRVVTAHPSARTEIIAQKVTNERVVVDGNLVTSQSPGTAMEFAFRLVSILFGEEKAREVNKGVLARL